MDESLQLPWASQTAKWNEMMTFPPWTNEGNGFAYIFFCLFFLQGNVKFNSGQTICFSKLTTARKPGCVR